MISDHMPLSILGDSPLADKNVKENTTEKNKFKPGLVKNPKVIKAFSCISPLQASLKNRKPNTNLANSQEEVQPRPRTLTYLKSRSLESFPQPNLPITPNLSSSFPSDLDTERNPSDLDTERNSESERQSTAKEEKISMQEGRKLLATSLELIQQYKGEIDSPSSPKLAQTVEKNIRQVWKKSSLPLGWNELSQCDQYHELQLEAVHQQLYNKEEEIDNLKIKLSAQNCASDFHHCEITQNLRLRIQQLEQELVPLKQEFNEKTHFQRKLKALFELDKNDPKNCSIKNFYYMTVDKLTAFVIGVQALNSGLVARAPGWKDDLVSQIFKFLSHASEAAGAVGDLAFGGGIAIPLVTLPILFGTEFIWDHYRDWKKQKEFDHAALHFRGGLEAIERKNQYIAYGLAYLLQMQLRYCTKKGAEKIVEDWLYRLCYNLLKNENTSDEEIDKIACALMHIKKGKEKKHTIKTHAKNRRWNTLDLFNKAGIAYYYEGQLRYESCYSASKGDSLKPITRANKYGYFLFSNHEDAIAYKLKMTQNLQFKSKKEGYSFFWQKDEDPLGPPILEGDQHHINGPTEIPHIQIEEIETQGEIIPFPPIALSSPEAHHLKAQLKQLEESNGKLNEELHTHIDRLLEVEATMAKLMKSVPFEPQSALNKSLK